MRLLAISVGLVVSIGAASAADPNDNASEKAALAANVVRALEAEAEGDFLERQRLLREVSSQSDYAPAHWHRGEVKEDDGSWRSVQTSIDFAADDRLLNEYEQRRASLFDNMANHFAIARWCAERGLLAQSRAHLSRVIQFDPDNSAARRALGFQLIGGEWISPEELSAVAQRAGWAQESLRKYHSTAIAIARKTSSSSAKIREKGTAELMALDEPSAIPAIEAKLETITEAGAKLVVDWLANIDAVESSQALARYSIFHPRPSIRKAATQHLKERPLHDFVPDVLGMLTSPVSTMLVPTFDQDGDLTGYRQAFAQEKFDQTDFLIFDRTIERTRVRLPTQTRSPFVNLREMVNELERAVDDSVMQFASGEASNRNAFVERANAQVEFRNARVSELLSVIADREFTGDVNEMWDWWDDFNETKYQAYKPERYRRSGLTFRVPEYDRPSCECFVAGTPVVTRRGLKPIERVVVGDSVLSRDVQSGELTWKPVLRATTRPPEVTSTISVGDEVFRCTPGHLFWISGKGWQKASQIEAGDIMHGAGEPMVVTATGRSTPRPTFNLEVADFRSYFVGKSMVMTHDVTPRRQNRETVPGRSALAKAP